MSWQFKKHYTRDEARALLPKVREWLKELKILRQEIANMDKRLAQLLEGGRDAGGETVNVTIKKLCALKRVLVQFTRREIQVKDLDRGLIDFPAILGGKEVFLCWEEDEEDIEFWHDLDTGYAGRERIE